MWQRDGASVVRVEMRTTAFTAKKKSFSVLEERRGLRVGRESERWEGGEGRRKAEGEGERGVSGERSLCFTAPQGFKNVRRQVEKGVGDEGLSDFGTRGRRKRKRRVSTELPTVFLTPSPRQAHRTETNWPFVAETKGIVSLGINSVLARAGGAYEKCGEGRGPWGWAWGEGNIAKSAKSPKGGGDLAKVFSAWIWSMMVAVALGGEMSQMRRVST